MLNENRIAILRQYLLEDGNDSFSRYALALELQKGDQLPEAMNELVLLLQRDPNYLPAYYQLAFMYGTRGEFPKAIETAEQGLVLAKRQGNEHTARELAGLLLEWQD